MYLIPLILALALMPIVAWAQTKGPLDYSLTQYGFTLAVALLGGLVSWIHKVRKGEAQAWNLHQLVGELCTSSFAGLLAFWLCEGMGIPAIFGAALIGISGHMGTRAISAFETYALRRWGASPDQPPPRPGDPQ